MPRLWQFGEQQFGFRVVFIGPQVFKTKDANDSDGLVVPAGLWSMCWMCVSESLSLRIGYAKRMLVAVSAKKCTPPCGLQWTTSTRLDDPKDFTNSPFLLGLQSWDWPSTQRCVKEQQK